ncbi:MAG TPA: hypothetical protein VMZ66_00605 [Aeromicrobium sp.]|nr:hypothetical protein [Aeromicrobium sp.]
MRLLPFAVFAALALAGPAAADDGKHEDATDATVSTIGDDRIVESSGLALSARWDDLAYTINDSGHHPMIYAIRVSNGDVVGVTDLNRFDVEDTESVAVDSQGVLWLGDLGDNDHVRNDVSIIAFPEPGPGDHHLGTADQYGVTFPDGPVDVEGLLVQPETQQVHLVSKNRSARGAIYALPTLRPGASVTAKAVGEAPKAVTDATFTHDGRWALLRTNDAVWVYNPKTWQPVDVIETPRLQQGESITVERGDRTVLLGSEGQNSPILRVPLPVLPDDADPIRLTDPPPGGVHVPPALGLVIAGALLIVGAAVALRRNRV